jgi:hypothetical protein
MFVKKYYSSKLGLIMDSSLFIIHLRTFLRTYLRYLKQWHQTPALFTSSFN